MNASISGMHAMSRYNSKMDFIFAVNFEKYAEKSHLSGKSHAKLNEQFAEQTQASFF